MTVRARVLQVIHCDIKTQNVLLSKTWDTAKITDVGVAQLLGNYNPDNVGCRLAAPACPLPTVSGASTSLMYVCAGLGYGAF